MKVSLVVLTAGKMEGKVLEIKVPQFLIGRDADCQLRPASPLISKRHCAIHQRDDQVFVEDFGSTNGTHVNEQPVTGEVELNDGDVLKVGPIQFAVRMDAAVAPSSMVMKTATKPVDKAAKVAGMDPKKRAAMEAATIPQVGVGKAPPVPAPAAPATKAEPPKKKAPPPPSGDTADDDIAAMLMSMGDDTTSGALSGNDIPDGSTVHDLKVPDGILDKAAGDKKPDELAKTKAAQANTSSAAKSILDKYLKRPRS